MIWASCLASRSKYITGWQPPAPDRKGCARGRRRLWTYSPSPHVTISFVPPQILPWLAHFSTRDKPNIWSRAAPSPVNHPQRLFPVLETPARTKPTATFRRHVHHSALITRVELLQAISDSSG